MPVTEGADCYVLSNLLVSMADDDTAKIPGSCRRAMAGGGKVIVIEWIMPTGAAQPDEFVLWGIDPWTSTCWQSTVLAVGVYGPATSSSESSGPLDWSSFAWS